MNRALVLFALLWSTYSSANLNEVRLVLPILSDSPNLHHYFHELLTLSVKEIGYRPEFTTTKLPQSRIKAHLDSGRISIYWLVESQERDQEYLPINTGLTNGLIGKRILFIHKDNQYRFDRVNSLDDFRKLGMVGAMGKGWYDVKIWRANNLLYKEKSGSWQSIFPRVAAGRDYDYFSRGLNEILAEHKQYPALAIEKRLVLEYQRDFKFYLSKKENSSGIKYHDVLSKALEQAKRSGLIEKLVNKYWKQDLETLDYKNRLKLRLKNP